MDTKKCTKCKEEKDVKNFPKDKKSKDGLNYWCKGCTKEYRENNKDRIKEYRENNKDKILKLNKKYRENNKYRLKEKRKEYRENNKDRILERNKKYRENNKDIIKEYYNSFILFNSNTKCRQNIELYEEIKQSDDGYLMCTCTYCGEWYKPTISSLNDRLKAINGTSNSRGECRLYCSGNCKNDCPSYQQKTYFKDQIISTSREVQPELRQMVFERDNYTCQKCDTHKDNLDVGIHCHHIEGILWEPLESADIDMCITYCADCHKEVHKIDGCGYHEMKCA